MERTPSFQPLWSPFIVLFLFKVGYMMLDATIRPYVTTAVCREMFYPETTRCSSGSFDAGEEVIKHDRAALYLTYYRLALNIPCIVFGFLIGALSDQIGRKLLMTIPIIGMLLSVSVYTCIWKFPQSMLILFIIGTLIQGISCTSTLIKITLFPYVVENVASEDVTRYLSILNAMGLIGQMIGSLCSSLLHGTINVQYTLCVVSFINVCTFIIVIFFLTGHDSGQKNEQFTFKSFLEDMKDLLKNVCKERPGKSRYRLLILLFEACFRSICYTAVADVTVLYIQGYPLHWPPSWYGYVTAVEQSSRTFGLLFLQPFFTAYLGTSDLVLLLVCFVWGLLLSFWMAFSIYSWMMWLALALRYFTSISTSTLKSLLSKEVDFNDLGKVYAIVENLDIVIRAASLPAYIAIYASTSKYFPGMAYLIQAGGNGVFAALTLFIIHLKP